MEVGKGRRFKYSFKPMVFSSSSEDDELGVVLGPNRDRDRDRSSNININISFTPPRSKTNTSVNAAESVRVNDNDDSSSSDSTNGESCIQNLHLHINGSPKVKKPHTNKKNYIPDRYGNNSFAQKKRIITPPRKIKSGILKNKKQRLERANFLSHLTASASVQPSSSSTNVSQKYKTQKPRPTSSNSLLKKTSGPKFNSDYWGLSSDDEEASVSTKKPQADDSSESENEYSWVGPPPRSKTPIRIPTQSKRNQKLSHNVTVSSDSDDASIYFTPHSKFKPSSAALKTTETLDKSSKDLANLKTLFNHDSSSQELSVQPSSSKISKPEDISSKSKKFPNMDYLNVTSDTESDVASATGAASGSISLPKCPVTDSDVIKNNGCIARPTSTTTVPICPKRLSKNHLESKTNRKESLLFPPSRFSSDADGSSNANSGNELLEQPSTSGHNFSCHRKSPASGARPKVYRIESSSDSSDNEARSRNQQSKSKLPCQLPKDDIYQPPESPGVAEALEKIKQMEADEAYAKMLQFELNQDLYTHLPENLSTTRPTHTDVGEDYVNPIVASATNVAASAPNRTTIQNRNGCPRALVSRTQTASTPAIARSSSNRVPRGRSIRRYHQPANPPSLLDSPPLESFVDLNLRNWIAQLQSEDEDLFLTGTASSRNRGPHHHRRSSRTEDNLDELLEAVISANGVINPRPRQASRSQVNALARRRSPRSQRLLRSHLFPSLRNADGNDYDELLAMEDRLGPAARVGLTQAQIQRLPITKFVSKPGDEEEQSCHICLCEYCNGENLRTLPCFHSFHATCIGSWISVNDTCPVCRMKIPLD